MGPAWGVNGILARGGWDRGTARIDSNTTHVIEAIYLINFAHARRSLVSILAELLMTRQHHNSAKGKIL
jgi:hypothetical protein